MKITAAFLQELNGHKILMMPEDSEFPFIKIKLDYIFCSHNTWQKQKYKILKNTLTKPKVIFIDTKN